MRLRTALMFTLALMFVSICDAKPSSVQPQRYAFSQPHMGTIFRIVLYAPDKDQAEDVADQAFARVEQLDRIMSDYRETSELMSLCRRAGSGPVRVGRDLYEVIERAQKIAAESDGAFDITIGPVVKLWRRARRTRELPRDERLQAALALTSYKLIHLNPSASTVELEKSGMQLDLGGIAKGYAADAALAIISRNNIKSALVAAGGDIAVSHAPPAARGWRVALGALDPARKNKILWLQNAAVSTSGDEQQNVEIGGQRYSHIVDPRTGIGVTGHSATTVIAPDAATTDAFATALSVLGHTRALRLIDVNGNHGIAASISVAEGEQVRTYNSARWTANVRRYAKQRAKQMAKHTAQQKINSTFQER